MKSPKDVSNRNELTGRGLANLVITYAIATPNAPIVNPYPGALGAAPAMKNIFITIMPIKIISVLNTLALANSTVLLNILNLF